jgi:pyruvate ferredoxin oxidoreductase gamma subunit
MIEIRFHGRGGQGAVTAAELIAQAAIAEGLYAQAFPNFGPERRGAPITAFLRISDTPIYLRERIDNPDIVIVLDSSLIGMVDFTSGLKPGKTVIINTGLPREAFSDTVANCYTLGLVDATRIAKETIGVPISNTAIIGALLKIIDCIPLEAMSEPFKRRFKNAADKNLLAMNKAYTELSIVKSLMSGIDACEPGNDLQWEDYLKKEALLPWNEVEIGCDIHLAGSCHDFCTGNWRTMGYPKVDPEKCISCGLCWIMCPDLAFSPDENGTYMWLGQYCKGCGICVTACPKDAISMEEE